MAEKMIWDSATAGSNATIDSVNTYKVTSSGSTNNGIKTNVAYTSGKYYMEFTIIEKGSAMIGICNENSSMTANSIGDTSQVGYYYNGNIFPTNVNSGLGALANDIVVQVKIDVGTKTVYFGVNDKWSANAYSITGTEFYPMIRNFGSSDAAIVKANFGQEAFTYSIPDGYSGYGGDVTPPSPKMIWDATTANSNVVVDSANPLKVTVSSSGFNGVKTNIPLPSGKIYMEFTAVASNGGFIGVCNDTFNTQLWSGNDWTSKNQVSFYFSGGTIYPAQSSSGCGGITAGDTIGIKFDTSTRLIAFCVKNVWSGEFGLSNPGSSFYPLVMNGSSGASSTILANFGESPFVYDIPEGYEPAVSNETLYLLKSGDAYYSVNNAEYDTNTKTYTALSGVTADNFNSYGFPISALLSDVTIGDETFKPITKFKSFKLVSIETLNNVTIKGLKSSKELVISRQNLNLMLDASEVNSLSQVFTNTGSGSVKLVFSLDNGMTWKTWNTTNSAFEDLSTTIGLNINPSSMTTEQLTQWNNFTEDICANGISPSLLATLDFTSVFSVTNKNVRFAFVISRPALEDSIKVSNVSWNYDKKGKWYPLNITTDVSIGLDANGCEVTALNTNLSKVKVNILV